MRALLLLAAAGCISRCAGREIIEAKVGTPDCFHLMSRFVFETDGSYGISITYPFETKNLALALYFLGDESWGPASSPSSTCQDALRIAQKHKNVFPLPSKW